MAVSKQELKRRACEAIDKNRDKIVALGDSIFSEPELGYKEFKTSEKIKKAFDEMGYKYQDGVAITGVVAPLKGKESKIRVAVMGEMDAVVAPGHRCANKETGAAHSCGHNCMCAGLVGVGYAFAGTGIMEELSGDVVLMAVPAEEYVEIEYRNELKKAGKIWFLGGKQEFVKLGVFDDIDIMIMQHTSTFDGTGVKGVCGGTGNGFMGKLVRYIGKEAHAGGAPHLGINALNAAQIGLMAVNANRETFQDKDHIRVHPIITKGGDLVNVVPADVRIETFCRGNNEPAILDASKKVDRALKAGADAVGAQVEIIDLPGYMLPYEHLPLKELVTENLEALVGKENVGPGVGYTTDANDVAHIVPTVHACIAGAAGVGHSSEYEITDKENAYIVATKMMLMSCIDLLADGAERGLKIKESWKAPYTKEQYLKEWGNL
ncbi:MAG: amidohydrolase [Oscillospiraceae bacterium]|nr:MAG: amidohydrolase [Oscillospiraceae bacterium]